MEHGISITYLKMRSSNLGCGDLVAYTDPLKREKFGDMVVENVLPNNRVDVRQLNNPRIWVEYTSDLELIKKKGSPQ